MSAPPSPPLAAALAAAERIAEEAGQLLIEGLRRRPTAQTKSSSVDLVTEYDRRSEALVIERLAAAFPGDTLVGEEGARVGAESARRVWYVDPLDGTTNFSHGLPLFAVSLGLVEEGEPVLGVVHAPALGWRFSGAAGVGAFLNGAPIQPSRVERLDEALVVTGFPYAEGGAQKNLPLFGGMLLSTHGARRLGAAALDLAIVACGWVEGYWERHVQPWDLAGGAAIVRAAGGQVTDVDGGRFDSRSGRVLATNGRVHAEMAARLARLAADAGLAWP